MHHSDCVVLLSIPGLRASDLAAMPNLSRLMAAGDRAELVPSFPCVTWPVQANLLSGKLPAEHGVVANGFFWRDKNEVEMWTAWNDKIQQPQIWDSLHEHDPGLKSAVWFPMLSKGSEPTISACPLRFTILTGASRSGAIRSRSSFTARCGTRWAISR